ncbi:hypothetical protein ACOME3_001707 [Neoechinorhynchus agilis]
MFCRAVQRVAIFAPKQIRIRALAYGHQDDALSEPTTEFAKTFFAAIKRDDPVVRTLKEVKVDYDKISSTGKQTLIINTVLANLYLGEVIGVVPLLSGVGAYLSYKYLKHTGKLAQMIRAFKNV